MHPFYVGTQAHPELKSRPTRAHPLFRALVAAALDYSDAERLPVEIAEPAVAVTTATDDSTRNGVGVVSSISR